MARTTLFNARLALADLQVPVPPHSAVRERRVSLRMLHERDQCPLEQHRYCSKEGREVPEEERARGFEKSHLSRRRKRISGSRARRRVSDALDAVQSGD